MRTFYRGGEGLAMEEKEKADKSMCPCINADKKKLIVLIEENLNYNNCIRRYENRNSIVELIKKEDSDG